MFPSVAQSPERTGWFFWLPPNIGKFGCSSSATSSRAKHGWVWSSRRKKLEGLCPRRFPVLCGTWLGGNSYWARMCVSVASVWSALVRGLLAETEKQGRGLPCPVCHRAQACLASIALCKLLMSLEPDFLLSYKQYRIRDCWFPRAKDTVWWRFLSPAVFLFAT